MTDAKWLVKSKRIKLNTGSIMKRSQLRAARALLSWSQGRLAEASGVSLPTIKRLEPGDGLLATKVETMEKLRRALEQAGVEFTNGAQPGVRLSRPIFLARPLKDYSAWYVLVTWPDGASQQVYDFKSEAEAESWIEHDSSNWLSRHPKLKWRDQVP